MTAAAVHVVCILLVGLDFVVRTWRTQLFLRALGYPLAFHEVFVQSALGETASSLTPMRAGGEPARIWAMVRAGVPSRVAVVSVALELIATSAVIVAVAVILAVTIAPDWWSFAGPGLVASAVRRWRWIAAVAVLTAVAWWVAHRVRPGLLSVARDELAAARGHVRDIPLRAYIASVPLTLLNIAGRVAILPILSFEMADPPPLAATVVGSFTLLYAQAVLPTPAGAGAVEIGFLGGAAGDLGAIEGQLLFQWRFYTTVLGSVLGAVLAVARYHTAVLPASASPKRTRSTDP